MAEISLATAQRCEFATELRLKFASMDERGTLQGDAVGEEYPAIFEQLPGPWTECQIGLISTRTEATRPAHHLTNGEVDLVAVEHETGLELLLLSIGTGLSVNAISELAKALWTRWTALRAAGANKQASSFVVEVSGTRGLSGDESIRLVVPPPVTETEIDRFITEAAGVGRSALQAKTEGELEALKRKAWLVLGWLGLVILGCGIAILATGFDDADPKRLVGLSLLAGGLGSGIAALVSAADRIAQGWELESGEKVPRGGRDDRFSRRMIPLFTIRPLLGAGTGLIAYFGLVGGLLLSSATDQDPRTESVLFLAALAGLFAKTLIERLKDTFDHLVGKG